MSGGLGIFPLATELDFLRASELNFRLIDIVEPKFYEDIRFISTVNMRGFVGFNAPGTLDDSLYNTLTIRVSIPNFPNSAALTMTRTIVPGSDDVINFAYTPSQAQYETNLADAVFPPTITETTRTQTLMVLAMESTLNSTVRFELSNLFLDPLGGSKSVRGWQHLMLDNLAAGRVAIEAMQAAQIAAGTITENDKWLEDYLIVENGTFSSFVTKGLTYLFVPPRVPGLLSDNPPTGNLPPLHGVILQIQRGVNSGGAGILQDVLGVEGAHYYPGGPVAQQIEAIDFADSMMSKLPDYRDPHLLYTRNEILSCSETRHRIHQSPVFVRQAIRAVLTAGFGTEFPIPPGFAGVLGPNVYPFVAAPTTAYPVDTFNRVQFDNPCPANSISDFWNLYADSFAVDQIYELSAATNINGFTIPP